MSNEDWEELRKKLLGQDANGSAESIWSMFNLKKSIEWLHREMFRRELAQRIAAHRFSAN